ncbi:MAG: hypothetical protein ABIY35_08905, partial [Chitinophagaceae bacterium]
NASPGAIIVFHDSKKAWERIQGALPEVLEHFSKEGYTFKNETLAINSLHVQTGNPDEVIVVEGSMK